MNSNKFVVDEKIKEKLDSCFEDHCLADELSLFDNYDTQKVDKKSKYKCLAAVNKGNIFKNAQPKMRNPNAYRSPQP